MLGQFFADGEQQPSLVYLIGPKVTFRVPKPSFRTPRLRTLRISHFFPIT